MCNFWLLFDVQSVWEQLASEILKLGNMKSALTVDNRKLEGTYSHSNATLHFLKTLFWGFLFIAAWAIFQKAIWSNLFRQKGAGFNCDVIIKTVNANYVYKC